MQADQRAHGLPPYIRPLCAHQQPVDIQYLATKGALTLPDDELQRALLRTYIQYVHGFMPILDLSAFLRPIVHHDGSATVSLLLFQAVMFSSVAFVDLEYLTARGYSSRRSARKVFFEKVRLLHDLAHETDRVAHLQALLLMAYWYERPEDERETWYWTGIALSQAQVLGMHRNPDHLDISPALKGLRKRIWWSCFMRDRLVALGIRRPARIRSEDFNVPMLTLDDFDTSPFEDKILRFLGPLPMADDRSTMESMAVTCIELAQLCVHIGTILFTQYSILGNSASGGRENIAMMVVPRKSVDQLQEMAKCDLNLEYWLQNLNPACRYQTGNSPGAKQQNEGQRILHLHQALLYMIYLTATAILHRPRALQSNSNFVDSGSNTRLSRDKVADAVTGITGIVHDLCNHDQLRYVSTSTIPALLSATLILLLDIRSAREEVRYTAIGRFFQCWQALHQLRDMYASADHAVWFLEAVIEKTNVHIPMFHKTLLPANAGAPPRFGGPHILTGFGSISMDSQTLDAAGQSSTAVDAFADPMNFGAAPPDAANAVGNPSHGFATMLRSFTQGTSPQPEMEDTINVYSQGGMWAGSDTDDNLLQSLVHFDADPNFFTANNVVQ